MAPRCRKRKSRGRRAKKHEKFRLLVHERLVQYFRPHADRPFDWTALRRSKSYLSRHFLYDHRVGMLHADFVFGLFERHGCPSTPLVRKWLRRYCHFRLRSYGYSAVGRSSSKRLDLHYRKVDAPVPVRVPPYEHRIGKFAVRRLLLRPFLLQDHEIVDKLLAYGGIRSRCMRGVDTYSFMFDVVRRLKEDPIMRDEVTILGGEPHQQESLVSEERLKFILLGMDVVLQKRAGDHYSSGAVKSLKMVFEALTQPFVTLREMALVLDLIIEGANKAEIIRGFCNDFLEIFPKAVEPYQPRQLMHLCRCKIRSRLRKCKTFPYGARYLDIPKFLQSYILLQD